MTTDEGASGHPDDLAAQLTRRVEELVEFIRDRSVRPLLTVASALVAGIAGVVIALGVLTAVVIGLMRLVDHDIFRGRVWAGDFLIGGMLGLAGLFLLRMSTKARRHDVRT
jgi:hypothetical protein